MRREKLSRHCTLAARTKDISKNIYLEGRKGRKEKYEMTNAVVYDLNDLTYLIV